MCSSLVALLFTLFTPSTRAQIVGCGARDNDITRFKYSEDQLAVFTPENTRFHYHMSALFGMLCAKFEVNPTIKYYDDNKDGMNALAFRKPLPVAGHSSPGTEKYGTILLGGTFIRHEQKGFANLELNESIVALVAHEFAHISQNNRNSNFSGKYRELQADWLAGWFFGIYNTILYPVADPNLSANLMYRIGDLRGKDASHGSPEERRTAFTYGYYVGASAENKRENLTLDTAYTKSSEFVLEIWKKNNPGVPAIEVDFRYPILTQ